ncbi:hypothetical protein HDU76_008583 [Blyttiomyces sp. JEL0837]|nr:hypothetical protein HDU76_008583 [Blyttiomyces sp. JEL0837]
MATNPPWLFEPPYALRTTSGGFRLRQLPMRAPFVYLTLIVLNLYSNGSLFAGATLIPESKYRTNITIASYLIYAVGDYYGTVMMQDAAIELAIKEINEDPNILPNAFVNMARFNAFNPDQTEIYPFIDSGGYAIKAAIDVAQSKGRLLVLVNRENNLLSNISHRRVVIGAVGDFFSKTTV